MSEENPQVCYACRNSPCKCEMTELEQLKRDYATVNAARDIYDRDYKGCDWKAMIGIMEKRIAKLEAEADPWREAKASIIGPTTGYSGWLISVIHYARHLESENAKLQSEIKSYNDLNRRLIVEANRDEAAKDAAESRVAELEARNAELEAEVKAANEMLRGRETRMTQASLDRREAEMEAKHASLHDALREAQHATPKEHAAAILKAANDSLAMKIARATEEIEAMKAREVPPLDPKRVYVTAMCIKGKHAVDVGGWPNAEPYPLQEPK